MSAAEPLDAAALAALRKGSDDLAKFADDAGADHTDTLDDLITFCNDVDRLLDAYQHLQEQVALVPALVAALRTHARCGSCGGHGFRIFSLGGGDRTAPCVRCGGGRQDDNTYRPHGDGLADDEVRQLLALPALTRLGEHT